MCDRFLQREILVWSVSVWEAIKFILSEFKEGKDKCVK